MVIHRNCDIKQAATRKRKLYQILSTDKSVHLQQCVLYLIILHKFALIPPLRMPQCMKNIIELLVANLARLTKTITNT